MSESDVVEIRVDFNIFDSHLKDILEDDVASAVWVNFRRSHIMSEEGLHYLGEASRRHRRLRHWVNYELGGWKMRIRERMKDGRYQFSWEGNEELRRQYVEED